MDFDSDVVDAVVGVVGSFGAGLAVLGASLAVGPGELGAFESEGSAGLAELEGVPELDGIIELDGLAGPGVDGLGLSVGSAQAGIDQVARTTQSTTPMVAVRIRILGRNSPDRS